MYFIESNIVDAAELKEEDMPMVWRFNYKIAEER